MAILELVLVKIFDSNLRVHWLKNSVKLLLDVGSVLAIVLEPALHQVNLLDS